MKNTIENLAKAFVGESQARNRYTFYSKIAKEEGFEEISEIFLLTAENEREHAKQLLMMVNQLAKQDGLTLGEIKIDASVPTTFAKTAENLSGAIAGEHYENSEMYPSFAAVAEKEGLGDIAARLRAIANAESHHEERYKELLSGVESDTLFNKDKKVQWVCRKCGYVHEGEKPPENCPSCDHPKNYFEIKCEVY